MAKNLRKGSKVSFKIGKANRKGIVIKKVTARKGELDVPDNKRTLVFIKSSGQNISKRVSEVRRIKKL